jgi:hypothetical protein
MLIAEERPDFLYKYMSASRAAQLIETLRLYMSPGAVLNDLYDFNITGFWQKDEDTKYRIFAKRMLVQGVERDFEQAVERARRLNPKDVADEYGTWLSDNTLILNEIMDHSGVTCFSSLVNNQRTWGTYGANHTGAVVELYTDGQKWPMASCLRSAIYTEHRLPVCPSRLIKIDDKTHAPGLDDEVLRMLLCAKHMDWRDENEWRLIMLASTADAAADRLVPLPRSAIARVFLGPRISAEDEAAIIDAARNHEPAIPVFKRAPGRHAQREYYQGAEIITDYAQLQYWEKRHGRGGRDADQSPDREP